MNPELPPPMSRVWYLLLACCVLGLGALLLILGYAIGLTMARPGANKAPDAYHQRVETPKPAGDADVPEPVSVQGSVLVKDSGSLSVDWLRPEQQELMALPFTFLDPAQQNGGEEGASLTKVGTITEEGDYKDWPLYRLNFFNNFGMGSNPGVAYMAKSPAGKWTLFSEPMDAMADLNMLAAGLGGWSLSEQEQAARVNTWLQKSGITADVVHSLDRLTAADAIADESGKTILIRTSAELVDPSLAKLYEIQPALMTFADGTRLVGRYAYRKDFIGADEVTNDPMRQVRANNLYYLGPDNFVATYSTTLIGEFPAEPYPHALNISWTDGTTSTEVYYGSQINTGCGAGEKPILRQLDETQLVQIGTYQGTMLYGAKNPEASADYRLVYDNWAAMQAAYLPDERPADTSFAAFMKIHPIFYAKDSLGRWNIYTSTSVVAMAECGKPVIYLYPEEKTDLLVKVDVPRFTVTEPAYNNGWRVTVNPDGSLLNKGDGQMYPYLFWEGEAHPYPLPEYYDVVAGGDVSLYLVQKLWEFGLNETEIRDFMEFWVPRMKDARYYKISWTRTEAFNQLAPLSISATPDTLIRVLMEFSPLAEPVESKPAPVGARPDRRGFTVVEWGGVLK